MLTFQQINSYVFLVTSDSKTAWKSNGLLIKTGLTEDAVLIDCSFQQAEIDQLIKFAKGRIKACIITHVHIDHASNAHHYESLGIPVYCPNPEDVYFTSPDLLIEDSGALKYGARQQLETLLFETAGFRKLTDVRSFNSDHVFNFGFIQLTTIPLPGHSPGHTGFVIQKMSGKQDRPILFVTDIGLQSIGAWYAFKYCSLPDLRLSVSRAEKIYQSDDFILASSHSPVYLKKENHLFQDILDKIDQTKQRLLDKIPLNKPVSVREFIFQGIYYRKSSIEKMDKNTKKFYYFWEGYTIEHLMRELAQEGILVDLNDEKWIRERAV